MPSTDDSGPGMSVTTRILMPAARARRAGAIVAAVERPAPAASE
jgi:hypothetical protein